MNGEKLAQAEKPVGHDLFCRLLGHKAVPMTRLDFVPLFLGGEQIIEVNHGEKYCLRCRKGLENGT